MKPRPISASTNVLRCKLPCGCWVQWEEWETASGHWHWSYHAVQGGWAHDGRSRSRLHRASNPNVGGRRYLAAAMVASGYGLAARARTLS